jgi:hypothetical protein
LQSRCPETRIGSVEIEFGGSGDFGHTHPLEFGQDEDLALLVVETIEELVD